MKKFVKKYFLFQIALAAFMSVLFLVFLLYGQVYEHSFQGMISRKYACLKHTKSPKVVYVSGSSGLFGVDTDELEKQTGRRVVNLALHAGFGTGFVTNMAVRNLQKGDMLVLAYEYTRWGTKPAGDAALIVSAIDNHAGLYQYAGADNFMRILKYLPTHCMKKTDILNGFAVKPEEAQSFDAKGNLAAWKRECTLPEDIAPYAFLLSKELICPEMTTYVRRIGRDAKKRGAKVVFAAPPVLDEAVDLSGVNDFCRQLTNQTGIKWISQPDRHLFHRKDMRDTIWHCNYYGKNKNTKQLAQDLLTYFENQT